jgi:cytochrome P450/NADPH-cytochrome P450 reductase
MSPHVLNGSVQSPFSHYTTNHSNPLSTKISMENLTAALASLETANDDTPHSPHAARPIPYPPGLPILGNLAEIDREVPLSTFLRLADTYGSIFALQLGSGPKRVFISSVELLEEACDEARFRKIVTGSLEELRAGVGAGLFTAHHGEHAWGVAHRILMPAFGPMAIREMFDGTYLCCEEEGKRNGKLINLDMHDIASQLVMKWARHGPENRILATDDFTRLTLDTLALCTMDYRFNSFYQNEMHEFVDAMVDFLVESGKRANRPKLASMFLRGTNQKYDADVKLMKDVASSVVKARRAKPSDKKDLLNAMINGRDPKTGDGLSDELIVGNM